MAVFLDWITERTNDGLTFWIDDLGFPQVFFHRAAGDCQAVAVHEAFFDEHAHERHSATDLYQIVHEVFSAWLQIAQNGSLFADASEVVNAQLHIGCMGHRDKMKHGIGAAAERDDQGDGIFKRFFRHDVAGRDAQLDHVHDGDACIEAVDELVISHSGLRA